MNWGYSYIPYTLDIRLFPLLSFKPSHPCYKYEFCWYTTMYFNKIIGITQKTYKHKQGVSQTSKLTNPPRLPQLYPSPTPHFSGLTASFPNQSGNSTAPFRINEKTTKIAILQICVPASRAAARTNVYLRHHSCRNRSTKNAKIKATIPADVTNDAGAWGTKLAPTQTRGVLMRCQGTRRSRLFQTLSGRP